MFETISFTYRRAVVLAVMGIMVPAFCGAEAPRDQKKQELPKRGVLSRSSDLGYTGNPGVQMPWGPKDRGAGLEEQAPISGSVSKVSEREWRMRVFNTSDDTYSVDLKTVQRNGRGTVVKTDSMSYTLKPKSSAERPLSTLIGVVDVSLEVVKWKNLTAKKGGEAPVGTPGSKQ